ncbi:MAG: hypothetical protein HKL99_10690 [Burkholderiales bacterium]|nr:hypothetical protein [Burkholderiales bacterium]
MRPIAVTAPPKGGASSPGQAAGLVQIGAPALGIITSSGFGRSVPLDIAMKMLVPSNWVGGIEGIPGRTPVSWRNGQSWPQALGEIADRHGWTVVLDWTGHTVSMEAPAPAPPPASAATRPTEVPATAASHVADLARMAPGPSFDLVTGEPIEQQLIAWGKKAKWGPAPDQHWAVMWSLPHNWTVPGEIDYGHDFVKAITQVVTTMAANGADARIQVKEANHVVLIHPAGANGAQP